MAVIGQRTSQILSILCAKHIIINLLRFFALTAVLWGELGIYLWSLTSCRWPDNNLSTTTEKPVHILLISDPQVRNPSGYYSGESSRVGFLRRAIYDSTLRKNWRATSHLNPHMVIFLGDMLAGGKYARSKDEYEQYANRFHGIFRMTSSVPVYYLPGNNDVGMGTSGPISRHVRQNYIENFGQLNQYISVGGHTFVFLDAPGLVDEDYKRNAQGIGFDQWIPTRDGPIEFVKTVPTDQPLVLFSHIPLARPDTATCGPLRERGTITRNVGHGYQNTLGKQTSVFLLQTLRPSAIFSGDNRDYCEYTHTVAAPDRESASKFPPVREVTLKSFSPTRHIRQPGFQLLSVITPDTTSTLESQRTIADSLCLLPDQHEVYRSIYIPMLLFTFVTLFAANWYRLRRSRFFIPSPIGLSPRTSGNATPLHPPQSGVWSPYTPSSPFSPNQNLPPLRMPSASAGPAFRATSRPSSPYGTPVLSPMMPHDEDEEEAVDTAQYAHRRLPSNGDWSLRTAEDFDGIRVMTPSLLPPAGWKAVDRRGWSWSWTFVFRGRRRRMTLSVPAFTSSIKVICLGDTSSGYTRPRSLVKNTVIDTLNVAFSIFGLWCFITWWTL